MRKAGDISAESALDEGSTAWTVWRRIAERVNRPGRMKTEHRPATTRSEGRRLGDRFGERLRINSWCLTSTDSATTGAAGTGEPGVGRYQMQKQDGQIAHRTILSTTQHGQEYSRTLEFAMHRLEKNTVRF
jgi:hypothetical protein